MSHPLDEHVVGDRSAIHRAVAVAVARHFADHYDEIDQDEVVAECYAYLRQQWHSFDAARGTLEDWAFHGASKRAPRFIGRILRQRREVQFPEAFEPIAPIPYDENMEVRANAILRDLPEATLAAVRLVGKGLTQKAAGARLGVSDVVIGRRIRRAREAVAAAA